MLCLRVKIENDDQRTWLHQHFPEADVSGVMGRRILIDDDGNETVGETFLVRGRAYIDNTEENKAILAEAVLRTGIIIDAK